MLLTQFDYGPSGYSDIKTALEAKGHTVDIVNGKTGGSIATALTSSSYDLLFFYDLTSTRYVNDADISAIGTFFSSHQNIVQDARSYGYNFQGSNASEVALIQNVAEQLDVHGGGLWVGTDHAPGWTQNANPVLTELGFNPISGMHSQAVNSYDPASVLLDGVVASELWAAGQSVGHVSLGIQPNGLDMRFHFGHSSPTSGAIPYISASFGNFVAPDENVDHTDPDPVSAVPLPAAAWLLLGGFGAMAGLNRRRSKSG
ncbi:VPLPA-CTERM sorting domain-containing protein [Tropicimonas sp. IMCC34043]|uniref:VPLPA-CTERM sorting domain-containing protein n=1 Tax=Tropicimonas sp. IMCC34043 TaxID=2248760 RepID=UPI0013004D0F|nr:VPLPA-CTERM sorting domain-containing protein [Tropicimonas sp. IMCC34043]